MCCGATATPRSSPPSAPSRSTRWCRRARAAAAARILLPEEMSRLTFQPGFAATILDVQHLSPEQALKLAGALQGGQTSQLLTLGDGGKRLLAKLSQSQLRELRNLLALMDRPGVVPATRLIRPERTAAATLQASAAAAWQAMQRVAGGSAKVGEVLVAPDGLQLLLIAATEDMAQLEQVVRDVDRSEPTTTQNYRPLHFSLDDVATLIGQLLKAQNGAAAPDIIKDRLTNSLVVTATVHQHERITALIRSLDETPTTSRRQMRIFPIKHRRADELARMLGSLLGASSTTSDDAMRSASGTGGTAPPTPTAPTAESPGNGGMPNANNAPRREPCRPRCAARHRGFDHDQRRWHGADHRWADQPHHRHGRAAAAGTHRDLGPADRRDAAAGRPRCHARHAQPWPGSHARCRDDRQDPARPR